MKNNEIYDRIELCEDIISQIKDTRETQAFILYSGTGIGKTSVSKKIAKLVDDRKIDKDIIRIKSTQDDSSQEGFFISNIFQNIRKYYLLNKSGGHKSKKKKYSYKYYIRHQNFMVLKKLIDGTDINLDDAEKLKDRTASILQFIKVLFNFIGIKIGFIEELV